MPEAIAISAIATRRPPSDTSCTALTKPSAISARTKSPLRPSIARSTGCGGRLSAPPAAALAREPDGRRPAPPHSAQLAQIDRLAEPAGGLADHHDRIAFAF